MIAYILKFITENNELKRDTFKIDDALTFYSAVIAHAYYAIFYSAKAYLVKKGIVLPEQGQHQAVYFAFRKLVREGNLAVELLTLYEEVKVKAETLLEIFEKEEKNRTEFTYKTLAQANKEPADASMTNAQIFLSQMKELIEKSPEALSE